MVILQLALVAAQALLDALESGVKGHLRIIGLTCGMQVCAGIEMHQAICREARLRLRDDHLPGIPSVEVFGNRILDSIFDPLPERFTDFHLLAGYTHTHGVSLLMIGCVSILRQATAASKLFER